MFDGVFSGFYSLVYVREFETFCNPRFQDVSILLSSPENEAEQISKMADKTTLLASIIYDGRGT